MDTFYLPHFSEELEFTQEERQQTIESLTAEMGTPEEFRKSQLIQVIQAQHDGANNGWWDVFCQDCDGSEVFQGSVEMFAKMITEMGWAVDSIERFTAICPNCQDVPDTAHYASQFEDNRGLLG